MSKFDDFEKRYTEEFEKDGDDELAFSTVLGEFARKESLGTDEFLKQTYEKFDKRYPMLIRIGFCGIVIMPILFLVLLFSLEAKLVFLNLWIASIIISATYLIIVEYIDYKYRKRLGMKDRYSYRNVIYEDEENEDDIEKNTTEVQGDE